MDGLVASNGRSTKGDGHELPCMQMSVQFDSRPSTIFTTVLFENCILSHDRSIRGAYTLRTYDRSIWTGLIFDDRNFMLDFCCFSFELLIENWRFWSKLAKITRFSKFGNNPVQSCYLCWSRNYYEINSSYLEAFICSMYKVII